VAHLLPLRTTAGWESGVAEDLAAALQSDLVNRRESGPGQGNKSLLIGARLVDIAAQLE
jgi:hypothetical protein